MKKLFIFLFIFSLLFINNAFASDDITRGRLNIEEEDGSPSVFPYKLKITSGSLTDNLDGTTSLGFVVTETDPLALKTAGTDNVKDTHIDWGTGATQVNPADFVNQDIGDITITTGDWAVEDDSHAHTGTSLSSIDISGDTNLAGDTEIVLTGDALSIASTITRDTEWNSLDFLVGTATTALSGEIVVGTAPGGSLGGTWASPTIDDLFLLNSTSDTMAGTLTADGFTLGTNEYLTFGTKKLYFDAITENDFILEDDLNINDTDPHLKLVPASGDAFETYAFGNEWYFTNVTDSKVLWKATTGNLINFYNQTGFNFPDSAPTDNYILKYDAALGRMAWEADATGAGYAIYIEEGDVAKANNTAADLYVDFDATDFETAVVGNEVNVTIPDDGHAHTTTSLSGIDISADTNLAGDAEIVLTGDALSIASTITRDTELSAYQTILTNSAGLLGALNDETGTGLAVFGTSPTFTTQITTPKVVSAGNMTFDSVNAAAPSTITLTNSDATYKANLSVEGNASATTYGSDSSVTDAELLYINTLTSNAQTQISAKGDMSYADTRFKVGSFTRDTTLASGTQAITGVGFAPKVVIFLMGSNSAGPGVSAGVDNVSNYGAILNYSALTPTAWYSDTNQSIWDTEATGEYRGHLSSLDADGFTVTWTKASLPTRTITIVYLAFR